MFTFNAPISLFQLTNCKDGLKQWKKIQKRGAPTQAKGIPKMVAERKAEFMLWSRGGGPDWRRTVVSRNKVFKEIWRQKIINQTLKKCIDKHFEKVIKRCENSSLIYIKLNNKKEINFNSR